MTNFARELWRRIESIHAVTYFAPESVEACQALGVKGFWRCYFGYRAAPLGACSAGTVTATFFGFSPAMVERAVPEVWDLASPTAYLDARTTSAAAALRRLVGAELDAALSDGWLLDVLDNAGRAGSIGARPLFAANRALDIPDDPVAALWQHTTNLREHRGDGHVNAWSTQGFSPVEVAVFFVADGATTRESLQPTRGWTDDEWSDATTLLEEGGILGNGDVTPTGSAVRQEIEATTDALAHEPFAALDHSDRQRLLDILEPAARAIGASSMIPAVNPMGVPLVD